MKSIILLLSWPLPTTEVIWLMSNSAGILMRKVLRGGKGFVVRISKFRLVTALMEAFSAVIATYAAEPTRGVFTFSSIFLVGSDWSIKLPYALRVEK